MMIFRPLAGSGVDGVGVLSIVRKPAITRAPGGPPRAPSASGRPVGAVQQDHARPCLSARLGPRGAWPGRHLGDAEIEDLDRWQAPRARGEEEIGRLDVAVNDPSGVRLGEGLARLAHIRRRLLRREDAALIEHRLQVGSLEVLHDDEGRAGLEPPHVVHRRDMPAVQPRDRARLAEEALHALHVAEHRRQHELDGAQLEEIDVRRRDDDAHGPDAEDALDAVLAGEDLTDPHGRRRRGASRWPPRGCHWHTFVMPLLQLPLAHSPLAEHGDPILVKHMLVALQVVVAGGQESMSSALITGEQVPSFVGRLQLLHVTALSHVTSQQTPSAQTPLWHLFACAAMQGCPLAALTQLPAPSHVVLPGQVLGAVLSGWPFAMFPQVPGITPSVHD